MAKSMAGGQVESLGFSDFPPMQGARASSRWDAAFFGHNCVLARQPGPLSPTADQ